MGWDISNDRLCFMQYGTLPHHQVTPVSDHLLIFELATCCTPVTARDIQRRRFERRHASA